MATTQPNARGARSTASKRFKGVVRSVKTTERRLSLSKEETEAVIATTNGLIWRFAG